MPDLISVSVAASTTAASSYEYVASVGNTLFSAPVLPGSVFFVPNSQAYYWTREWQLGEAEADADILAGNVHGFDTMSDAIAVLFEDE